MKIKICKLGIVIVGLLCGATTVLALEIPNYSGFVTDTAGMLSPEYRTRLGEELENYKKESGNEFAVLTVPTLDGDPIEDFAVRVFEKWGIGKKGENNGLLLVIALEDRQARIEVGYGLEPYITDARAGDVIRNDIAPAFQGGKYDEGVESAVASLKLLAGGYITETTGGGGESEIDMADWLVVAIVLLNFIFLLLAYMARTESIWLGGVVGAVVGIISGIIFGSVVIFAVGYFALGLLIDYILSRLYKNSDMARKIFSDKNGRGGGFWGGFGGGGGGGFGGFGGGFSGGGGASGRW